jgi:hypothetical protein
MLRSRLAATLFAVTITLAGAACGEDGPSGPSIPEPAGEPGAVLLRNDSNAQIVAVNITACTNPSWGENLLGASETIAPEALRTFAPFDPDCYDVRVSTASKSAYWYDRELEPGDTLRLALSPAANDVVLVPVTGDLPALKAR